MVKKILAKFNWVWILFTYVDHNRNTCTQLWRKFCPF